MGLFCVCTMYLSHALFTIGQQAEKEGFLIRYATRFALSTNNTVQRGRRSKIWGQIFKKMIFWTIFCSLTSSFYVLFQNSIETLF